MKSQWIAIGSLLVASVAGATTSQAADAGVSLTHVCATATPGMAHCLADVVTGVPIARSTGAIIGYNASQLEAAYKLPITRGAGQTIAIVDAFDDPTAEVGPRNLPQHERACAVHDIEWLFPQAE